MSAFSRETYEGKDVICIRIPAEKAHSLCVAMEPCGCCAPKSAKTKAIRDWFKKGVMRSLGGRG